MKRSFFTAQERLRFTTTLGHRVAMTVAPLRPGLRPLAWLTAMGR